MTTRPQGLGFREPTVLSIFRANGEPLVSVPLPVRMPVAGLASMGSTVAISAGRTLYLYDLARRMLREATLPGDDSWWSPYFSPDGTELWLRSSKARTCGDSSGRDGQRWYFHAPFLSL